MCRVLITASRTRQQAMHAYHWRQSPRAAVLVRASVEHALCVQSVRCNQSRHSIPDSSNASQLHTLLRDAQAHMQCTE